MAAVSTRSPDATDATDAAETHCYGVHPWGRPSGAGEVEVLFDASERQRQFESDVRSGLGCERKSLPSKWLYDESGCELFEAITELPEYYQTRAEAAVLAARSDEIAALAGASTLVEIGSGTSNKTRRLIESCSRAGTLRRFVAFDIAESTLRASLLVLGGDYPCVDVSGVVGDFEQHLDHLPELPGRMVVFLGGTIGNLDRAGRRRFVSTLAARLGRGECILIGTDLVKDPARLVAAYDDPAGVTEAFEKNALAVVNRAFGGDFDLDRFAYRAAWDEPEARIEMGVVSRGDQVVRLEGLGMEIGLDDGEEICTEVSAKFTLDGFAQEVEEHGFERLGAWTDPEGDFGVTLARRTAA